MTDEAQAITETSQTSAATEVNTETLLGGDTEAKTEGEQAPEVNAEEIVYDFKLPEGVELDTSLSEKAIPLFKEAKLPPEVAQKYVDLHLSEQTRLAESVQSQVLESIQKQAEDRAKGYVEACKADAEIGGANLQGVVENCKEVYKFFSKSEDEVKAFKAAMDETGAGNHPALVKLLSRVGAYVIQNGKEDTLLRGGEVSAPRDIASVLYGNNS